MWKLLLWKVVKTTSGYISHSLHTLTIDKVLCIAVFVFFGKIHNKGKYVHECDKIMNNKSRIKEVRGNKIVYLGEMPKSLIYSWKPRNLVTCMNTTPQVVCRARPTTKIACLLVIILSLFGMQPLNISVAWGNATMLSLQNVQNQR